MVYETGDIAWMLVSAALVLIMTPAVGFFYGGMLRKNSMLSILGQTIIIMGIATIVWVTFGFSLAFGPDTAGLIGSFDFAFLHGIGIGNSPPDLSYFPTTIPPLLYMMFQGMFAIITAALIIGGIAERMKLRTVVLFMAIWITLIYPLVAHWVWGGGWIHQLGALDFAGGTVVHISAGAATLAAALVIGKRMSAQRGEVDQPHNIPFVVLGGALLWLGWFGFNGGSALGANDVAVNAFVTTQIAAATAGVSWGLISYLHLGRTSVMGMITGAVVGLVAITPAAGFVDVFGALAIGAVSPIFSYAAIHLRKRMGFDDALDVWACHGVGGTVGAVATGLLATSAVNDAIPDGLLYGGSIDLLGIQLFAVIVVWAFVFAATYAIMWTITKVIPDWRMTREEERIGPDIVQHGESAYS
ncbi:MAG: ammonium transporter [Methanomassiliicoccaceae archaeon]|jgi:Amt family ammonium transporter|nr:ammonium transporter [Euryarchaeota archaeon]HOB37569.1 ammonium transporter [Methanomassiliicoccaceae archaeon]HOQ26570.1 ammonium transporter [Methanomassiliicoccaceae archaeon]HPP44292.1 ammonium transporter [Methanomassiliicoccaceae archaeon]HQA21934.1 ammonium transporter [Methanomassiliicoccaceae archaeon]